MAILRHGDLMLWLAGPNASASRPMPDGRKPEPGGWNRFVIEGRRPAGDDRQAQGARHALPQRDRHRTPAASRSWPRTRSENVVELFQPA